MIPRMLMSITGTPCACRIDLVASSGLIVGPGPRSCTDLPETPDEPRWLGGGVDRVPTLDDRGPARPPDPAIGDVNPVQGMSGRPNPCSRRGLMTKREIA